VGAPDQISIIQYDASFSHLIGESPTHSLLISTAGTTNNPFFHEACVFIPDHEELYITSNLLQATNSANFPTVLISRIKLDRDPETGYVHAVHWQKLRAPPGIDMPKGGVNFDDGILFCAQGTANAGTGGIYLMPRNAPPHPVVTNFHGRDFNSVNDIVMARDGSLWFTDPCYGYDQEFRRKPKLPNQVYRYDPQNGSVRVVADGFGRPNGICFSPDEMILYITDSDTLHGDGHRDLTRYALS
jgi:gluconolactonase